MGRKQILEEYHLAEELNEDFRDLVQKLNLKRKEFFVMCCIG